MLVTVLQRKDLHIFCYHDLSICSLYETQSKLTFHSSLFAPFVSVCWLVLSPCGRLGKTPGKFYYRNAKFWAKNLGTVNTLSYLFGTLQRHIRLVWSRNGYFGSTASRQSTKHDSTKLAWYAAEAYQKGTIRYKYKTMLQYLHLREQPLGIHVVSCIIKKRSPSVLTASRKSPFSKCNAIFPSLHPDREGKNVIFVLMLHAMHSTVYDMATVTI